MNETSRAETRRAETRRAGADSPPPQGGGRWLWLLLLLVPLAAVAFIGNRWLSADAIFAQYDLLRSAVTHHRAGTLAGFILVYAAAVTASLPGASVLTLVGGLLFGWMVGGAAAVLAATVGGTAIFLLARTAAGALLAGRAGPRLERILEGLRGDAVSYMLFMRLVPMFPFWLVNLAAALVRVPVRTFVLTTLFGIMPASFAIASAGAALDAVVTAQKAGYDACMAAGQAGCGFDISLRHILTPGIMISCIALGVLALLPVVLRRFGFMPQSRKSPPS